MKIWIYFFENKKIKKRNEEKKEKERVYGSTKSQFN